MPTIRDSVRQTPGYVPGEQPQTTDYVKLNTNENPYPPPANIFDSLSAELAKVRREHLTFAISRNT
jgi:histidinol-phosphate aminotransferase